VRCRSRSRAATLTHAARSQAGDELVRRDACQQQAARRRKSSPMPAGPATLRLAAVKGRPLRPPPRDRRSPVDEPALAPRGLDVGVMVSKLALETVLVEPDTRRWAPRELEVGRFERVAKPCRCRFPNAMARRESPPDSAFGWGWMIVKAALPGSTGAATVDDLSGRPLLDHAELSWPRARVTWPRRLLLLIRIRAIRTLIVGACVNVAAGHHVVAEVGRHVVTAREAPTRPGGEASPSRPPSPPCVRAPGFSIMNGTRAGRARCEVVVLSLDGARASSSACREGRGPVPDHPRERGPRPRRSGCPRSPARPRAPAGSCSASAARRAWRAEGDVLELPGSRGFVSGPAAQIDRRPPVAPGPGFRCGALSSCKLLRSSGGILAVAFTSFDEKLNAAATAEKLHVLFPDKRPVK